MEIENMSVEDFAKKCIAYNKENNIDISDLEVCPVHMFAIRNSPCCKDTVAGIKHCSLCGEPQCPVCGRHGVNQLSRVTGYISSVSGWGESKKQELKDRKRYEVKGGMI